MVSQDEPGVGPALSSRPVFRQSRNAIVSFADLPEGREDRPEVFPSGGAKSSVNVLPNCDLRKSPIRCTPHFVDDSDRLEEQGGLLTSEPFTVPGDRKVLTRRAEGDDIDRFDLPSVDPLDVPEMDHSGEPGLSDGARERLDLAGPGRYDADRRCRAGASSGAVEQTAQLHLYHFVAPCASRRPAQRAALRVCTTCKLSSDSSGSSKIARIST